MVAEMKMRTHWSRRVLRGLLGLGLAAGGVLLMLNHELLRQYETALASTLAGAVTPGESYAAPAAYSFFWSANTPEMHGLRVTAECTAAFLLGPLFIVAGFILASGRFSVVRALTATGIAGAVLLFANQGRLVLIAWATAKWGVEEGYQWSHTVGGSLVVGAGVALALIAFLLVLAAHRRTRKERGGQGRHGGRSARSAKALPAH